MGKSKDYGPVLSTATLAGGCFWCTEAIFSSLKGVLRTTAGYTGGNAPGKPTYREVRSGKTGHAEAIRIGFDPTKIPYSVLLDIFLYSHDPTSLNRQGGDIGTQYRSAIFYHDAEQRKIAERILVSHSGLYEKPLVTQLHKAGIFHTAESYHQEYYKENPDERYCGLVIRPKLDHLKSRFTKYLK